MTGLGSGVLAIAALLLGIALLYLAANLFGRRIEASKLKTAYFLILGAFIATTIASIVLMFALVNLDLSFRYVSSHTSSNLPLMYKIAAFWAGHEGSLLLWLWMIGLITAIMGITMLKKPAILDGFVLFASSSVQLFFLIVLLFAANPFEVAPQGMQSGMGMNPLLLHWAMVLHPPTLFFGFALTTIPFGYALGALVARDRKGEWLAKAQKWAIFAWLFLGIGNFLGALWAYVVLGWGGYWGWDPVENASILPWLTATALVHSLHNYKHRGSFKHWSLALAGGTFLLCIIGTFITRSGLIESVHAFERNNLISILFITYIVINLLYFVYLMVSRSKDFAPEEMFESLFSKEFAYYLNNLILVISMAIILFSVLVPPFLGKSVGPDFYNQLARPVGLVYLLLITVCPLLGWGATKMKDFLSPARFPIIATVIAAPFVYYYWWGLEGMLATQTPARSPNLLGLFGFIICALSLSSTTAMFFRWIRKLEKQKGIFFLQAFMRSWRINPRRFGAYTAHIGLAFLFAGLIGSSMYVLNTRHSVPEIEGTQISVGDLVLMYKGFETKNTASQEIYEAKFDAFNKQTGKLVGAVAPSVVWHKVQQQQTRDVDINWGPFRDVFIIFEGIGADDKLVLNILVNPLIFFVWAGSIIMLLGTTVALWPKSRAEELPDAA